VRCAEKKRETGRGEGDGWEGDVRGGARKAFHQLIDRRLQNIRPVRVPSAYPKYYNSVPVHVIHRYKQYYYKSTRLSFGQRSQSSSYGLERIVWWLQRAFNSSFIIRAYRTTLPWLSIPYRIVSKHHGTNAMVVSMVATYTTYVKDHV